MKHVVLDVSVAVKWYLPRAQEDLVDEAFELLRRHKDEIFRLIVPDFFWAEFGNVLWKSVRRGRLTETALQVALADMRAWKLSAVPTERIIERALSIALATGTTVYDSLYVALAVDSPAELVTADERLCNALGSRFPVRWLGSFPMT